MANCTNCDEPCDAASRYCARCGHTRPPQGNVLATERYPGIVEAVQAPPEQSAAGPRSIPPKPTASPWTAAFLSMLLIGLGQMSVGQVRKGVVVLVGGTLLSILTVGIAALVIMPLAAVDAYKIADKLRRGQPVGAWEFF